MSPPNRYAASHSIVVSSTNPRSRRKATSASPNRNSARASRMRRVPATTPYRRPVGSRRLKTSNTHGRSAEPSRSAALSIVNSYWSVSSAVDIREITPSRLRAGVSLVAGEPGQRPQGGRQLGPSADAELGVDAHEVVVDGPGGEEQPLGDLLAGHPGRGEPGDLPLPLRQRRLLDPQGGRARVGAAGQQFGL